VLACGPAPLLAAVRTWASTAGLSGYASLEAHMACGSGACHGCVVPTREGYLRVCVDGPVFALDLLGSGADQPGSDSRAQAT
jgi:dihydroorotate dehydrogenase electron transfer subunit